MSEFSVGQDVMYHNEKAVVCETPPGCTPATANEIWIFSHDREYHMCVSKSNLRTVTVPQIKGALAVQGVVAGHAVGAVRVEHSVPSQYRLGRYPDGTLVLQGAFQWQQGSETGVDWKTIPTFDLPTAE